MYLYNVNEELKKYVEREIIPRYDSFDRAHRRGHVETVIAQSLNLAGIVNSSAAYVEPDGSKTVVLPDMVYAAAAYHDTGLCNGRERHHSDSAAIIRADANLRRWFSEEQIDIIADAAEDHRASSKSAPRTIYGRIVAEADRDIVPFTIILRTVQFGLAHYPELSKEEHYSRAVQHMHEKYADGGYLKLWIPESPNAARLEELRCIIRDGESLRNAFEKAWEQVAGDRK